MQNNNRNIREGIPPSDGESLRERLHGWRLGFSPDGENIVKGLLCALLIVIFSLTQTTLFTRLRPFGVVPDLMLPLTVAVAMTLREKWGAIFGIAAAFVIESLGGSSFTVLPILYMLTGYIVGILSSNYFRDSFAVRVLYTLVTSAARAVFSFITLLSTLANFNLLFVLKDVLIPEFFANLLCAFLPHLLTVLILNPFSHERKE